MELEYNSDEVERFKAWLLEMLEDTDEYEYAEFGIAPGIAIECDWEIETGADQLSVAVLVFNDGIDDGRELFTRSVGDTLAETGTYGHGPDYGDELTADITAWIAKNFTDVSDGFEFEHHDRYNGDAWLFVGHIPNPKAED